MCKSGAILTSKVARPPSELNNISTKGCLIYIFKQSKFNDIRKVLYKIQHIKLIEEAYGLFLSIK